MASQALPNEHLSIKAHLELGELYKDKGDFTEAAKYLREVLEAATRDSDYLSFVKASHTLLRIYAEMEDWPAFDSLVEKLQSISKVEIAQGFPRTHYTLALGHSFRGHYEKAKAELKRSVELSLAQRNNEELSYAIYGQAVVAVATGRIEDARAHLDKLNVMFEFIEVPSVRVSARILKAQILRREKNYEAAKELLWKCYDDLSKEKNFYMFLQTLDALGNTYADAGEHRLAKTYLELAKKMADPENQKHFCKNLESSLQSLGADPGAQYDIIFDPEERLIIEKQKGRVDIGNQFVLSDLLRLFIRQPGQVFSKEQLVEEIWNQSYDPQLHDNKVYVTIKRLRKLIEPDYDKPKYIFRAKNGYFLSKEARVRLT